ncbi:TPA: hypothetical protein HA371_08265 [Candidatus Woesearchaeota archaeon]|nr:hypothetical protein [Candidatus Woesearchaeota archaeon]HIJ02096.1 hypothetical protein [Candidatus Woesearchaeota archaeon]HIJ14705.1 hypothetical protein [Candidatus Woesearchaeota archaeon]
MRFNKNNYNRVDAMNMYDWGEEWLKCDDDQARLMEERYSKDMLPGNIKYNTDVYIEYLRT